METPLEYTKVNHFNNNNNNRKKDNTEEEIIEQASNVTKVQGFVSTHHYQFRVCLIGDSYVGKTSLLKRYYDKYFNEDYVSTIGCDFKVVTLETNFKIIKLQIWDTAGQERFKAISINYFRSAHGFLFVFDISNKESFENVENWINTAFNTNKSSTLCNILIGNKKDLEEKYQRQVSKEEAIELATRYGMVYLETSAREEVNVEVMFHYLTKHLCETHSSGISFNREIEEEQNMYNAMELERQINKAKCKC